MSNKQIQGTKPDHDEQATQEQENEMNPTQPEAKNDSPEMKASQEAARYRTRLRELEAQHTELQETHATVVERYEALQWSTLDQHASSNFAARTHKTRSEQLKQFGRTISEFQNDDGTLNTEKYIEAVNEVAELAGWDKNIGPFVPRAGYQPDPPRDSPAESFTSAIAGYHIL